VVLVPHFAADRAHSADFNEGKTICLIIGNNTSAGYAVFGRLYEKLKSDVSPLSGEDI
jgi:hypothetical protein